MTKVHNYFLDLVKIDSPSGYEQEVAEYLTAWLDAQSFKYEFDAIGNILAKREGEGQSILLCARMDTVNPGKGIQPILEDGVYKSAGDTILGADNKAAIAGIMAGVENYLAETKKPKAIEILFTVKEETGGGIDCFDLEKLDSKKGIIFDLAQPIGFIGIAAPFIYNIDFDFVGKSAHSSKPDLANDALIPAIKFLHWLKIDMKDPEVYINVGPVSSDAQVRNTIPGKIELRGEIRSTNETKFNILMAEIEQKALACAAETGTECVFNKNGFCAGYKLDTNSVFVKKIADILQDEIGKTEFYESMGISDTNVLVLNGTEVVTLGDGITDPHTTSEAISAKDLEKISELINLFIKKI